MNAMKPIVQRPTEGGGSAVPMRKLKVWDLPTRVFHWMLVLLFLSSWWSSEMDWLWIHQVSGYTMLALLLFRIYWGLAGSGTSRFSSLLSSPRVVLAYVDGLFERSGRDYVGHNPLGGWSVILILVLLLTQCVLGLLAIPVNGLDGGPLSQYLTFEASRNMTELHERLFNVLALLAVLHVGAIIFYAAVKRQNLVLPMVTGYKTFVTGQASPVRMARTSRAVAAITVCGVLVALLAF